MPIHIQDPDTDWLVREFARRRNLGITAAIKTAMQGAMAEARGDDLHLRARPIIDRVRARRDEAHHDRH